MSKISETLPKLAMNTVTILSGQNLSTDLEVIGTSVVGMITPSIYTSTNIEFYNSIDGGVTYRAKKDQLDSELSYMTSADSDYRVLVADTISIKNLKLYSVTPQAQDVDIVVITRQV